MKAELKFIGLIETPYHSIEECPRNIQPNGPECRLILNQEYIDGMLGLSEGHEILILYWFEKVNRDSLRQNSRRTGEYAGVFALRTPHRPNPVGVAVTKIERVEGNVIIVRGLDCLNGTYLIDIKPAMVAESINSDLLS